MQENNNKFLVWILLGLYFLSGVTSLAYEVLWVRLLSIQFGVSIFAVVITVAAFMAGLGAGSLFGVRLVSVINRPLLAFGLLEVVIGLFSFFVPFIFSFIDPWLGASFSDASLGWWQGVYLVTALLILFLPAFVMGIGFPLVIEVLRETGIPLGRIYGINTLGGAFGALLPLALLPNLGWVVSLRLIVVISLLIGVTAIVLSLKKAVRTGSEKSVMPGLSQLRWSNLLLYAGIGAAALVLEIGWTRLFGMIFLRTEYVLAIILAVFLLGIGGGSLLARYLSHQRWFTLMPVIAGSFALLSLWLIPPVSGWTDRQTFSSLSAALLVEGSIIALLTFPVTLVFGAWLPLLNKKLCQDNIGGAWLYGANSIGAALGALAAGFILIPAIGTTSTLCLAAIACFVMGIIWSENKKAYAYVIALVLFAVPVMNMPPVSALQPSTLANTKDLYLYEDSLAITHVVEKTDGQRVLLSDLQRMDAATDPASVAVQKNQSRLPILLHAAPQSVLYLGLGTGISAAGSAAVPGLERVAVEISQGAINAAQQYFRPVNDGVLQNVTVVRDDAKRFLINNTQKYDVIVGDLFHPDLVGRGSLLSLQHFQRVHAHLNDGGVFVQWVALNQFDIRSLNIVLRTFAQAFDDAVMFVDAFRLALVGTREGDPDAGRTMRYLESLSDSQSDELTGGEGGWTWLGRYWGRISVSGQGPVQDEWSPQIEYYLPQVRYHQDFSLAAMVSWLVSVRPRLHQAATDLAVPENMFEQFERSFIASDLAYRAWLALFESKTQEELRLFKLAYAANPLDRWIGFALADRMYSSLKNSGLDEKQALEAVLKVRHDHSAALQDMWKLLVRQGEQASAERFRRRLMAVDPLNAALANDS